MYLHFLAFHAESAQAEGGSVFFQVKWEDFSLGKRRGEKPHGIDEL